MKEAPQSGASFIVSEALSLQELRGEYREPDRGETDKGEDHRRDERRITEECGDEIQIKNGDEAPVQSAHYRKHERYPINH